MSIKWTGSVSDSGILRKSEFKEKKEELFVFGYSCKLFRDDEKALHIDQGKHLIPWMGDETLKIDRYDARGALHDVASLEAPPGGFDWRVELTRNEQDVEQLCDEERYRALHTDEDEEEMYKEEELKRLHAAGYGQVGFNYDTTPAAAPAPTTPIEVDEPFIPTPSYRALFAPDILLPDSLKQNTIIEKTANFIASQGAQMEILIKAKQGDNPQFRFLDMGAPLRPYYLALVALVKAGKWPEKAPEVVEEKHPETDEYLHPSLASTVIESAPSIPSIHYRPSADCDYTMLVSKMRGEATLDDNYTPELAPGEVAPPGTEPLPPRARPVISRAPVMYTREHESPPPPPPAPRAPGAPPTRPVGARSTGLSLMKNYNTDSDSDASDYDSSSSDSKDKPLIITPPEDVQVVIDKMAAYVARNGDEFAEIVRAKNDPRFTFLEPDHIYHPYYMRLMQQKRGGANGTGKEEPKRTTAPVSFSIKKLKEPDPVLPKPALPYESSSDDETEKTDNTEKPESKPQTPVNQIPQAVVYKMEAQRPAQEPPKMPVIERKEDGMQPVLVQPERVIFLFILWVHFFFQIIPKPEIPQTRKEKSLTPEKKIEKPRDRDSPVKRDKRKHSKASKPESRERKDRSVDKERKRDKDSGKKNDVAVDEIISLEDNDDDLIDLTGDYSDTKMEVEGSEREKQRSRRARAAEFLRRVGVDPAHPAAAAALPASSLASAMVDTLESLRKKKEEEEEKRRRREKKRHRSKYDDDDEKAHRKKRRKYRSSEDNEESDIDSSKKKKRRRDKKAKSKKKKKREVEEEVVHELPPNIDLSNTLKVLRTTSPTKELCQNLETQTQRQAPDEERYRRRKNESSSEDERHRRKKKIEKESSSDEEKDKRKEGGEQKEHRRKKKEDREYSEGEWSSDSEEDSASSISRDN
ncbi:protein suppressor of white apricot [Cydia amplana]|uniref:protein suppressor of white apricot n=1 Tax=Cydia amplana TaxID=1869771 RepID=UPI002FE682EF